MYIAGFLIPVPEDKKEAYRKRAENGAAIFREYGCVEIVKSGEDNVPSGEHIEFRRAVDAEDGEKIVNTRPPVASSMIRVISAMARVAR